MTTFLLTLAVCAAVVLAMSVGLLVGRRLRGSCGDDCTCTPLRATFCRRRGGTGYDPGPCRRS